LKELEEEWGKLPPAPPAPTRFTRSQQAKMTEGAAVAPAASAGGESAMDEGVLQYLEFAMFNLFLEHPSSQIFVEWLVLQLFIERPYCNGIHSQLTAHLTL